VACRHPAEAHLSPLRAIVLLLLALGLAAVEVRGVVWGFAGTVVPGTFAPCEVHLVNPLDQPVSGRLQLRDAAAIGGVPWVAEVWLPPGGEQRLRFAPFIRAEDGEPDFELSWGPGRLIGKLPKPALAGPSNVVLVDGSEMPRRARLPLLPADRFPGDAALLDGLGCLVAAETPGSWEPSQAAALAAWVRSGGTLALLRGADLRTLAPGLQPGANAGGRVLSTGLAQEVCGVDELAAAGWSMPTLGERTYGEDLDAAAARRLAELVRPEHPWGLIRTVLVLFALAIGAAWWFGRRGLDWRLLHLGLLGSIALASVLLMWLGRRGYGEASVWTSLAILRPCGGQVAAEVRASVFVTEGSNRRIRHGGAMNLYACPGEELPVGGAAGGGALVTEIPLFSSRHLLWRGTLGMPSPRVEVVARKAGLPERLRLHEAGAVSIAALWQGGALTYLGPAGDDWRVDGKRETPEELRRGAGYAPVTSLEGAGKALFPLLVLRALDLRVQRPDRPCLFILTAAPPALAPREGLAEPHRGLALWKLDLPENP